VTREALVESVQKKAAEDAEAMWRDARAEVEALRLQLAEALEQQRASQLAAAQVTAKHREEAATAEAEHHARGVEAGATIALADRLYRLALEELARLQDRGSRESFDALAAELPPLEWQDVRVNPIDFENARVRFPCAQVASDESIAGGLEVAAEGGRIRVDNTLATRLARAWPDVLPGLIEDISRERDGHRPAA
jgi:V/A-type H+-transporting ATPase subunit E